MNKGGKKRGMQTKKKTLNYRDQNNGYQRGGGGGLWGRGGGDQESTDHDEHRVTYRIVEPLYCTPETDITLLAIPELKLKTFPKKVSISVDNISIIGCGYMRGTGFSVQDAKCNPFRDLIPPA